MAAGLAGTGEHYALLRGHKGGVVQLDFRMVKGCICCDHCRPSPAPSLSITGKQHVELILIGTQLGAGLGVLSAGVIKISCEMALVARMAATRFRLIMTFSAKAAAPLTAARA